MNMKNARGVFLFSLGTAIIVGTFYILYRLTVQEIPLGNQRVIDMLIGAVLGSYVTVISYFFGSSQGSVNKQEQLNKITDEKITVPSPTDP
jgi:hypothetical protein